MSKRGRGKRCAYCRRYLAATTSKSKLAATRDHVEPRVALKIAGTLDGARPRTVWACRLCNNLKGHLPFAEWKRFMAENPKWWETGARPASKAYAKLSWQNGALIVSGPGNIPE